MHIFFSLKKGTNSKLHIKRHVHICNSDKSVVEFQIYSADMFSAQYSESYRESSCCGPFEEWTL